jgi:hypothetical protein
MQLGRSADGQLLSTRAKRPGFDGNAGTLIPSRTLNRASGAAAIACRRALVRPTIRRGEMDDRNSPYGPRDAYGRRSPQDYTQDYGSGRDYTYSSAREYAAAGELGLWRTPARTRVARRL